MENSITLLSMRLVLSAFVSTTDLYNIRVPWVVVSNYLQRVSEKGCVIGGPFSYDGYHWPLRKRAITVWYLDVRLVGESLFTLSHFLYSCISHFKLLVVVFYVTIHKRLPAGADPTQNVTVVEGVFTLGCVVLGMPIRAIFKFGNLENVIFCNFDGILPDNIPSVASKMFSSYGKLQLSF